MLDAERVVRCMPGATLAEVVDDRTWPPTGTWASADVRRHLARVLTGRAVEEALSR